MARDGGKYMHIVYIPISKEIKCYLICFLLFSPTDPLFTFLVLFSVAPYCFVVRLNIFCCSYSIYCLRFFCLIFDKMFLYIFKNPSSVGRRLPFSYSSGFGCNVLFHLYFNTCVSFFILCRIALLHELFCCIS